MPIDDRAPQEWAPQSFSEIIGQAQAAQRLKALVHLSRNRDEPLPHILLAGAVGTGKRTLAAVIARELGVGIVSSGPLEGGGDLMGLLTNLNERDVFFMDEIHRLPRVVEELLHTAMEDFSVDFVMDKGLNARTMRIPLRPFTFIGATEKASELRSKLRSLFPVAIVFQPYSESEVSAFAQTFARNRGFVLIPSAAALIGRYASGSLHQVKAILQLAGRPGATEVSDEDIRDSLAMLGHYVSATGNSGAISNLMDLSGVEFEVRVTKLLERL